MTSTPQTAHTHRMASTIQTSMSLVGQLSFVDELHIHGTVTGDITSPLDSDSLLVIHPDAKISGEIRVPYAIINGYVSGDIFAARRITLQSHANIEGNVHYTELAMDKGATVNGILAALDLPT